MAESSGVNMWVIDIRGSCHETRSHPLEVAITDGYQEYSNFITPLPQWSAWGITASPNSKTIHFKLEEMGIPAKAIAHTLNAMIGHQSVFCDDLKWDSLWLSRLYQDTEINMLFEMHDIEELMLNENILMAYFHKKFKEQHGIGFSNPTENAKCILRGLTYALEISNGVISGSCMGQDYFTLQKTIDRFEDFGWKRTGTPIFQNRIDSDGWEQKLQRDSKY